MGTDFEAATGPLRRELLAHCYRMMGSATDAEDLVQETYLRAWRAYPCFEGRSSVRTWMYRIATNACLSALSSAATRVLPTGLGAPAGDPCAPLHLRDDLAWVEPLPEAMLWQDAHPTPEERLLARENLALAWTAALQQLPPRQRAAILLCEVLGFSAAAAAETLDTSVASLNSALQRGRSTIGGGLAEPDATAGAAPGTDTAAVDAAAVGAFVDAFEAHDFAAIVASMAADVTWQMPPFDRWYAGPHDAATLAFTHCPARAAGDLAFRRTVANGAPAVGMYLRKGSQWEAFQLQVLHVNAEGLVDAVTGWFEPHLFRLAGLPLVLGEP